jgi:hypothetical protein
MTPHGSFPLQKKRKGRPVTHPPHFIMDTLFPQLQALIQDNNANLNSKLNKLHIKLQDKEKELLISSQSTSTSSTSTTTDKTVLSLKAAHKLASLYSTALQQYSRQLDWVNQLLVLVNQELGVSAAVDDVDRGSSLQRIPSAVSSSSQHQQQQQQQQRKRKKSMDIKEPLHPSVVADKGHKKARTR